MAQPTQVEMPTYIIYRDIPTGQPFDPTGPLDFYPPKGSDDLFDALRAKFPHLTTHSARMRQAVIEFLVEETPLDTTPEQQQIPVSQMTNLTGTMTSPWSTALPSTASSDTWSSPETFNIPTPNFGNSPVPLSRQFSVATSVIAPSESSPPGLDQMTGVFSLTDSTQPKQRVRRKMTEQEKIEYRKRRIVKACDKCAKRKRKCNHNQQDMDTLAGKSQKIPRSSAPQTIKKPPAPNLHIAEFHEGLASNQAGFTNPFEFEPMQPFEDFGDLLNAPLPDLSLDDMFETSQTTWPWADTPDFTLMDASDDRFATMSQDAFQYPNNQSPTTSFSSSETDKMYDDGMLQSTPANRQVSPMIWEHLRTGQQSNYAQFTQSPQSNGAQFSHVSSDGEAQQVGYPQHHDWNGEDVHESKQSMTGQQLQETKVQTHLNERAVGDGRRTTHSQAQRTPPKEVAIQDTKWQQIEARHDIEQTSAASGSQITDTSSNPADGKQPSHNIHTRLNLAKRKTDGIDASIMISGAQNERPTAFSQQDRATPRQESLSLGELGEGILANTSPSTELFMLRRRIPKALHSIVDRNNTDIRLDTPSRMSTQTQIGGFGHDKIDSTQAGVAANVHDTCGIANISDGPTQPARTRVLPTQSSQSSVSASGSSANELLHTKQGEPHEDRLSDHLRRRDHFGRHLGVRLQVLSAVAGLGCLLMLLSILPPGTPSLSMLLLALASADSGARGSHFANGATYWSECWGTYVPVTTKNESCNWLAKISIRMSDFVRGREDTSSSTWVKEPGKLSRGSLDGWRNMHNHRGIAAASA